MRIQDNRLFKLPDTPPNAHDPAIRRAILETGRRLKDMLSRQELYATLYGTELYGKAVVG